VHTALIASVELPSPACVQLEPAACSCGHSRRPLRARVGRERGGSTEATGTLRRDVDAVTMYLSGRDIRPIGCEPAEFIEARTFAPGAAPGPGTPEVGDEDETSVQQPTARVGPRRSAGRRVGTPADQ
jgi:hypothetical protein